MCVGLCFRLTVGTCEAALFFRAVWVESGWEGERRSCVMWCFAFGLAQAIKGRKSLFDVSDFLFHFDHTISISRRISADFCILALLIELPCRFVTGMNREPDPAIASTTGLVLDSIHQL